MASKKITPPVKKSATPKMGVTEKLKKEDNKTKPVTKKNNTKKITSNKKISKAVKKSADKAVAKKTVAKKTLPSKPVVKKNLTARSGDLSSSGLVNGTKKVVPFQMINTKTTTSPVMQLIANVTKTTTSISVHQNVRPKKG